MRMFLRLSAVLVFLMLCAGQVLAAPIGQVTALVHGVFVDRGGQEIALALKDSIEAQDTLRTDASGKVQILFADNSSVTLGSNTTMTMEEFAFEGGEPEFKANLGQGLMRVITGAIVEQNPKGFGVTTPEANIGIRGTIFTAQSKDDHTTVWVENTTKTVSVNGIDVPAGQKITVPGTPAQLLPITNEDREYILDETTLHAARGGHWIVERRVPPTDLVDVPLVSQTMGDSLYPGASPTPPPPVVTTALFSGTLGGTFMAGPNAVQNSTFSFSMDLASGNISNAKMYGDNVVGGYMFTVSGGSGSMAANGSFTIAGFSGRAESGWSPAVPGEVFAITTADSANTMNGSPTGGTPAVGGSISGVYSIDAMMSGWSAIISGEPFTGSRTQ